MQNPVEHYVGLFTRAFRQTGMRPARVPGRGSRTYGETSGCPLMALARANNVSLWPIYRSDPLLMGVEDGWESTPRSDWSATCTGRKGYGTEGYWLGVKIGRQLAADLL